jgi:hypothetical protein
MYKMASKNLLRTGWRDIPRKKLVLRNPKARATADELLEFETSQKPLQALLNELRPIIKRLRAAGHDRPSKIALKLNAEGRKTAQGRRWSERRVILLLRLLSQGRNRRKAPPKRPAVPSQVVVEKLSSPEEMIRRLIEPGRIKRR